MKEERGKQFSSQETRTEKSVHVLSRPLQFMKMFAITLSLNDSDRKTRKTSSKPSYDHNIKSQKTNLKNKPYQQINDFPPVFPGFACAGSVATKCSKLKYEDTHGERSL